MKIDIEFLKEQAAMGKPKVITETEKLEAQLKVAVEALENLENVKEVIRQEITLSVSSTKKCIRRCLMAFNVQDEALAKIKDMN